MNEKLTDILHSVYYNSIITIQTNECTQFY